MYRSANVIPEGCAVGEEPLLDGANPVPDNYFTATSEHESYAAHKARMSADNAWVATFTEQFQNGMPFPYYLQVSSRKRTLFYHVDT